MREYLLSQEEMQRYDKNTVDKIGMPAQVLMERSANAVVRYILNEFPNNKKSILVVAGNGNNGGDGVAIARILMEYNYNVVLLIAVDEDEYSPVIKTQTDIAKMYEVPIIHELDNREYDIIVDALFGIGLNRNIAGDYSRLIKKLNSKRGYKISVDIPSGIDCNTGEVLGTAFIADTTVTFGFYKRGQFLNDGPSHTGYLVKTNIGINEHAFFKKEPEMFMYMYDDNHNGKIDIGRNPMGNKGSFGKVLLIAGREDMSGACVLAAKAALRSGCGMVALLTEEANRNIMIAALPECIVHTYKDTSDIAEAFAKGEEWADAIAVGPGISTDDIGLSLVKHAIFKSKKPLIIDADAINILSRNKRLKAQFVDLQGNADTRRTVIFTPHVKEFARLSEKSMEEIKDNKATICQSFSRQYHSIIALKDAYTVVCEDNNVYINIISNDAMATAGSGDVLTGLMCSLLSQYIKKDTFIEAPEAPKSDAAFLSAIMAVFVHSRSGLKASEMNGRSYMIASDVIEKFSEVLV